MMKFCKEIEAPCKRSIQQSTKPIQKWPWPKTTKTKECVANTLTSNSPTNKHTLKSSIKMKVLTTQILQMAQLSFLKLQTSLVMVKTVNIPMTLMLKMQMGMKQGILYFTTNMMLASRWIVEQMNSKRRQNFQGRWALQYQTGCCSGLINSKSTRSRIHIKLLKKLSTTLMQGSCPHSSNPNPWKVFKVNKQR